VRPKLLERELIQSLIVLRAAYGISGT